MGTMLLIVRLALSAVFAVAAVAKLFDRPGTVASLASFGVPPRACGLVSLALPALELAIALTLIPLASAAWAALAAALLLAAFSVAVVRVLARGEQVDCNCFGSLSARPVGRGTLIRNLVLLGAALFLTVAGWDDAGTSAVGWLGDLDGTETALAAVAAVLGIAAVVNFAFSWQLLKQNGRLLTDLAELRDRLDGRGPRTKVGQPAPDFDLPSLEGEQLTLADLLAERRGLTIVFSDPDCGACDPLLPAAGRLQRDRRNRSPLVVISRGSAADNLVKASEHGLTTVLLEDEFRLARSLGVTGMPGAVMLDVDGRIADVPAMGTEAVAELLSMLGADEDDPIPVIRAGG
jgi:peroxiredoxin